MAIEQPLTAIPRFFFHLELSLGFLPVPDNLG